MRWVVLTALCIAVCLADGRCKVSKVRAICESRCEKDGRPTDRTAIPPPGTLMPPTGIYVGVEETQPPPPGQPDSATGADPSDPVLLEMESSEAGLPPQLMKRGPVTPDQVEAHVAPAALLAWTNAKTASFGCVDGRAADGNLGTWGGDIAEFVTALNVYEQMTSTEMTQTQVTNTLRKFLEVSPRKRFRTCMSEDSLKQLFGNTEDLLSAIKNPPEERQAAMWVKIVDPAFIGNEHLQLMLEDPEQYLVRRELVQHVIHSFYDILWNPYDPLRDHMDVQVLPGQHRERAILSVTVPDFCIKQANVAPLIAPLQDDVSIAIHNPDAVQVLRRELSLFFARETLPLVRADEMNKRINVLAAGQGGLTKLRLFDRIPTYSAKISE